MNLYTASPTLRTRSGYNTRIDKFFFILLNKEREIISKGACDLTLFGGNLLLLAQITSRKHSFTALAARIDGNLCGANDILCDVNGNLCGADDILCNVGGILCSADDILCDVDGNLCIVYDKYKERFWLPWQLHI